MERLVVLLVLMALAVAVAFLLQRRRPDPPTAPSYRAPRQLDRSDFNAPDTPTLVVVFASESCESCPAVWETVAPCASETITAQLVTVQSQPDLHRRYRIDGVPTTIVADAEGTVVKAFFGPLTAEDLAEALLGRS